MKPINFIDETAEIGEGTTVWHFATILQDVKIGQNCSIGSHAEIGAGSIIGDDVRISAHVFLPSNSVVESGAFLGPGVRCADDRHPRANNPSYTAEPPHIEAGASIGMNATLLPGVRIGAGAMVGAGAIVTKDVAPHTHVRCEPAREKPYSRVRPETTFDIYAPNIRERVIAGEKVRERA